MLTLNKDEVQEICLREGLILISDASFDLSYGFIITVDDYEAELRKHTENVVLIHSPAHHRLIGFLDFYMKDGVAKCHRPGERVSITNETELVNFICDIKKHYNLFVKQVKEKQTKRRLKEVAKDFDE